VKEGSEPEEQEDLEGKDEEGSEGEESETDYSSADENILTKAGRWNCQKGGQGIGVLPLLYILSYALLHS